MGQTTKLANLIDPEVLAAYIDKKLIDNVVFAPLAEVDTTLSGAPGRPSGRIPTSSVSSGFFPRSWA